VIRPGQRVQRPQGASVLDRIAPISFEGVNVSVLVYGQSGTGKTTFWATFPGPILCIISSGSFKPGELRSVNSPEYREKIKQVVLYQSAEMRDLMRHVQQTREYKTIVLDHVSGLQDLTLKEILGLQELPAQKHWGFATRDHYSQSTAQCKEYLRAMLNCQDFCNVVIVGQERNFNGPEDRADPEMVFNGIGVGVTPALASWLQPAVDYTLQAYKRPRFTEQEVTTRTGVEKTKVREKGVDFCLRCEPHDIIATKFRVPKGSPLPDYIVNPTYEKLMSVIRGEGLPEGS
jgi:hypothetical protein